MDPRNLPDEAALIVGFRVGNKAIRGWNQSSNNQSPTPITNTSTDRSSGQLPEESLSNLSEKSMEDWYKSHYYEYYYKAYKANGLDDATSSQYAQSCVNELERTGYIRNAIHAQYAYKNVDKSKKKEKEIKIKVKKRTEVESQKSNSNMKYQGLQNWIYRLFSTYRSNGISKEDIEWNQKLSQYSQYISERYKNSNKVIDWDLQNIPKREVIQNFQINKTKKSEDYISLDSSSSNDNNNSNNNNNNRKRFITKNETVSSIEDSILVPKSKKNKENNKGIKNNKKNSENSDFILDVNGNKRLTWQQILALGRSTEKIIGLSTALEKQYLRLTASPDPNLVRPEHILKKSLEFVLNNYLNYNFNSISSSLKTSNQNLQVMSEKKKYDWKYLEEQFRSIRQDLTVQGIKNLFTIQVYELNARIALENHDLGQFNQCQARLKELYSLDLVKFENSNREEFLCYYILYVTLQNMKTDLIRILDEVQPYKNYKGIDFALKICKALMDGNYCRYFKLCKNAPWKSKHLFEIFRNRQLLIALTTMTKAFRFIEIPVITSSLGFKSNLECHSFLLSQNATFIDSNLSIESLKLDCKSSYISFSSSPLLLNRKVQALG